MKVNQIIVLILAVLLSSCSSAQTPPTTTPAPIPTATLIPFSAFNLEDQLIQTGDLPPGYSASQIRYTPNDFTEKLSPPDYVINQLIDHNGSMGGTISVVLYEDSTQVATAYQIFVLTMIRNGAADAGVGEKSTASESTLIVSTADLAFMRCHAAVHIQFMGTTKDNVIAYGQRLDKRLQELVCRP